METNPTQEISLYVVLQDARVLLEQGSCSMGIAKDKEGRFLDDPMDRAAVAWDPRGAIDRAIMERYGTFEHDDFTKVEFRAMTLVCCAIVWHAYPLRLNTHEGWPQFSHDIEEWGDNPNTTQDDVLKVFDKALEFVGHETIEVRL